MATLAFPTPATPVVEQQLPRNVEAEAAMLGAMILLPLHLQEQRGLSPLATGLLVMPGGVLMGLLGPTVGRLHDRLGAIGNFRLSGSVTFHGIFLITHK